MGETKLVAILICWRAHLAFQIAMEIKAQDNPFETDGFGGPPPENFYNPLFKWCILRHSGYRST